MKDECTVCRVPLGDEDCVSAPSEDDADGDGDGWVGREGAL